VNPVLEALVFGAKALDGRFMFFLFVNVAFRQRFA
jgi:hypothetical protein